MVVNQKRGVAIGQRPKHEGLPRVNHAKQQLVSTDGTRVEALHADIKGYERSTTVRHSGTLRRIAPPGSDGPNSPPLRAPLRSSLGDSTHVSRRRDAAPAVVRMDAARTIAGAGRATDELLVLGEHRIDHLVEHVLGRLAQEVRVRVERSRCSRDRGACGASPTACRGRAA
jgi:hypothetical protein